MKIESVGGTQGGGPGPRWAWSSLIVGAGVAVLVGLGALTLVLAWSHAAGTPFVPLQLPAVVAAMVGLSLVGTGLAAVDLNSMRRQEAEEAEVLDTAIEQVRRWAEPGRSVRID